jgi:hypothetical protein
VTSRAILGHHPVSGNYGIYLSLPGYDVNYYYGIPSAMALNSDWGSLFCVRMSGLVALGQWVLLPSDYDFWPVVYWDLYSTTNTLQYPGTYYTSTGGYSSWILYQSDCYLEYTAGGYGDRYFRINGVGRSGYARYMVSIWAVA